MLVTFTKAFSVVDLNVLLVSQVRELCCRGCTAIHFLIEIRVLSKGVNSGSGTSPARLPGGYFHILRKLCAFLVVPPTYRWFADNIKLLRLLLMPYLLLSQFQQDMTTALSSGVKHLVRRNERCDNSRFKVISQDRGAFTKILYAPSPSRPTIETAVLRFDSLYPSRLEHV